jgi:predicted  nucleic acid-binding Zn-ribbon protein
MSVPEGIVQAQMESLLRRVAREQEMLSRRARDAAEEQSRSIVARAREEARARTRLAAEEARQSVERALADRRAALETAARQLEQSLLRELMDTAWQALPGALAESWREPARRREWCETACALARRIVMGNGPFTIDLDAAAPPEQGEFLRQCLPDGDEPPTIRPVEALGPGLRIRRGLACVDATVPGLLASRERVEAELLAELDALREAGGRVPT